MVSRAKILVTINNKTYTTKEFSEYIGKPYSTIRANLTYKVPLTEMMTKPEGVSHIPINKVKDAIYYWYKYGVAYNVEEYRVWWDAQKPSKMDLLPVKIGDVYTNLKVVSYLPDNALGGKAKWICTCICGKVCYVPTSHLIRGTTKSCGCYKNKRLSQSAFRHGLSKHPYYGNYRSMIVRCCNKDDESYKNYGGRGITICSEWLDPITGLESFISWCESQENYAPGLTIERKNVNEGYTPSNCCLLPMSEQAHNRRNSIFLTINGERMTLKKVLDYLNSPVSTSTARNRRFKFNVCWAEAITLPEGFRRISLDTVRRNINSWIDTHPDKSNGLTQSVRTKHLTIEQIYELRDDFRKKHMSIKDIAEKYGVDPKTVTNLANRKTKANY